MCTCVCVHECAGVGHRREARRTTHFVTSLRQEPGATFFTSTVTSLTFFNVSLSLCLSFLTKGGEVPQQASLGLPEADALSLSGLSFPAAYKH